MKATHVCVLFLWLRAALGGRIGISERSLSEREQGRRAKIGICAAVSQETLETHRRCSASLRTPSVLQRFPNLDKAWCDLRLRDIAEHRCESEEEDRLHHAALLQTSFRRITALVGGSEETLTAEGAWESCSSRQHSCVECESRYAGAREHIATAHACEWRAGACVQSSRQQPRPWSEAASVCGQDPAAGSFLETNRRTRNRDSSRADSNRTGGEEGNKVALLIGFKYSGKNKLSGTYLDLLNIFHLLIETKGFDARDIYVIYDEGHPSDFVHEGQQATVAEGFDGTPTSFWEKAYEVPVALLGPGDFFFFYFSGHGSQMSTSRDRKELDGKDEWLATPSLGSIMDNDFYRFLLRFSTGVSVTAVVDACHSEGFSDLPFNYNVGSMGEHFESEREWCTDWAHPMDELPYARITYISGSQNAQTSKDLGLRGGGGVFTQYATTHWRERTNSAKKKLGLLGALARAAIAGPKDPWKRGSYDSLFHRLKDMYKRFKRKAHTQEPNLCMWPTVTDSLFFDPFSPPPEPYGTPDYAIDYHPFVGGRCEGDCKMAVPPICRHGGRDGAAARAAGPLFDIVEGLKYAGVPYAEGSSWEGWEVLVQLSLGPSDSHGIELSEDAPDVVKYVRPGSRGALAGVKIGDIIRSVNGVPFSEIDHVKSLSAGGTLSVVGTRS